MSDPSDSDSEWNMGEHWFLELGTLGRDGGRQEEMDKELHEGRGKQAIRGRGTGSRVGNSEAGEDRRV